MLQLKHERFLVPPSPWNIHAATNNGTVLVSTPPGCKLKHGDVTSSSHVCSCLLEAPLATTPGQPCWVGKFAVWRFPVMQPSDIQVWEACPLPKYAWFVPDNCCICMTNGSGCVSLGCGGYDGDLLVFTSNPILLRFLDCTPSGSEIPKFNAARAHVEGLEQPNPSEIIACMFQRCKSEGFSLQWQREPSNKLFNASDPELDAALMHCVRLAVAAEKAYDAPKKVDAKAIVQLGRRLLTEAGLTDPETIWIRACPQGTARCTARPLATNSTRQGLASFESSHLAVRCRSRHPWPHVSPQLHEWPCGSFGTRGTGIHLGNLCY